MINIRYFTYPNKMYPGVYHLNKLNTFIPFDIKKVDKQLNVVYGTIRY